MSTAHAFTLRAALFLVAVVAGCGGGSAVNCAPTTVRACVPTSARGCGIFTASDGMIVRAAICMGGDARTSCQPEEHLVCVDDCTAYDGCSAP